MTESIIPARGEISDNYILVEDDNALADLCRTWLTCSYLAMDTEFIRTSTFFPHVGLIQINAGDGNYLIDPLTISEWDAFRALLLNPGIVKIFHSCSEDLQVFMVFFGLLPTPLFDTQIAGALLNEGFGCSYQNLVRQRLDIDLPKGETRSDWLQRPLDEKQCHYAALDVACLPRIYHEQKSALESLGRLDWLREECGTLLDAYRQEMDGDFKNFYLNIKGAWSLDQRQLGVLRALGEWRELRARKRDKPRNWIIKDKCLMDIAREMPEDTADLMQIEGLDRHFMRHEGGEVIELLAAVRNMPAADLPKELPKPLGGRDKARLKKAQQFAQTIAEEQSLPIEMLTRKRWLISILQEMALTGAAGGLEESDEASLPVELQGWRKALLIPGMIEAMK